MTNLTSQRESRKRSSKQLSGSNRTIQPSREIKPQDRRLKDIVSNLARFLDEASLFGERLRTLGDTLDTWHDEASSRHGVRTILTTPTLSGRDVLAQRGVVLEKYESLISSLGAVDDDLHGLAAVLGDGVVNPRAFVTNLRYVIRQIDSELKSIDLIIIMPEGTFLKQMASEKVWLRSMRELWLRISEMVWNNIRTTKEILECVEPKKDVSNADEGEGKEDEKKTQAPVLKTNELVVLNTLAIFDSSRLATSKDVENEIPPAQRISLRTIQPAIRRLVELGLAERPEGNKHGAKLTIAGRRWASRLAD